MKTAACVWTARLHLRPGTLELPEAGDKDIPAKSETVLLRHLGRVNGAGT
jgi:hypothetical protein